MPAVMVTETWVVDEEVEGESLFGGESQQDRGIGTGRERL